MAEPARGGHAGRIVAGALLLAWGALALRAFLGEGVPLAFDAHSHLSRAWLAERALAAGSLPGWSFAWYGGARLFELYAPGYHVLAGGLGLLAGDLVAATKLVLFAGQLASLAAVYALLLRLGVSPIAAAFGALLFLYDAGRWRLLAVIGNHPSVFVYVAAPLLMLAVARAETASRSALRLFAASALAIAAMAVGHLTTTLAVLPALLAFATAEIARAPRGPAATALAALGGGLVAAAALTAWLTVPMLRSLPLVSLSLERTGIGLDLEPVGVALGLTARSFRWVFVASPGAPWCALALAMAVASLRARHARWRPCALGLAASLASIAVLGDRAALGLIFFVAPLCAAALDTVGRAVAERAGPRAALAVQALAVAAVPALERHPEVPLRYDPPGALAVYARIPERGDAGRSFDVTPATGSVDGVYGRSSFSPYWSGRAIPFGGFPQGAPLGVNVQLALAGLLVQELASPRPALSAESRDLLQLLNVAWLVDRSPSPRLARLPLDPETAVRPEPGLVRLAHAGPALFAPRLEALPGPAPIEALVERWRTDPLEGRGQRTLDALSRTARTRDHELFLPLLRDLRIDRAGRRAERFFVAGPGALAPPGGEGAGFAVLEHREGLDEVEVVARAGSPGFVRLAYSFDPGLRVTLDGRPIEAVPDFLGALVVAFPAGRHAIALRAPDAALRGGLLAASGAIAAALVLVWAATSFPPRQATRAPLR